MKRLFFAALFSLVASLAGAQHHNTLPAASPIPAAVKLPPAHHPPPHVMLPPAATAVPAVPPPPISRPPHGPLSTPIPIHPIHHDTSPIHHDTNPIHHNTDGNHRDKPDDRRDYNLIGNQSHAGFYFDGTRWCPISERDRYRNRRPIYGDGYGFINYEPYEASYFESNLDGVTVYPSEDFSTEVSAPFWCDPVAVQVWTDRQSYLAGDNVQISIHTSDDAYAFVYSTDGSGITQQLLPNYYDHDNTVHASRTITLPSSLYELHASGNGPDLIHVIAINTRSGGWRVPQPMQSYSINAPFVAFPDGYESARASLFSSVEDDYRLVYGASPDAGIVVTSPGSRPSWGEAYTEIMVIGGGGIHTTDRSPQPEPWATVSVSSSPSNADVYLDNKWYGATPLSMSLPAGDFSLLVSKDGYETWIKRVSVEADNEKSYAVSLRPADGAVD